MLYCIYMIGRFQEYIRSRSLATDWLIISPANSMTIWPRRKSLFANNPHPWIRLLITTNCSLTGRDYIWIYINLITCNIRYCRNSSVVLITSHSPSTRIEWVNRDDSWAVWRSVDKVHARGVTDVWTGKQRLQLPPSFPSFELQLTLIRSSFN